jgi:hypothetical protein
MAGVTTRTTSATPSPPANSRKWLLLGVVLTEAAIVFIAASGLDGFSFEFAAVPIAIWVVLLWATARGSRIAWLLFSGFSALSLLSFGLVLGYRVDELAPALIGSSLIAQVALVVAFGLRTRDEI